MGGFFCVWSVSVHLPWHHQHISQCCDHAACLPSPTPTPAPSHASTLSLPPYLQPSPSPASFFYYLLGEHLFTLPGFSLSHLNSLCRVSTDPISRVSQVLPHYPVAAVEDKTTETHSQKCLQCARTIAHQLLYLPDTQRHVRETKQERDEFRCCGMAAAHVVFGFWNSNCQWQRVREWGASRMILHIITISILSETVSYLTPYSRSSLLQMVLLSATTPL